MTGAEHVARIAEQIPMIEAALEKARNIADHAPILFAQGMGYFSYEINSDTFNFISADGVKTDVIPPAGCGTRNGLMVAPVGEFCPHCLHSLTKVVTDSNG